MSFNKIIVNRSRKNVVSKYFYDKAVMDESLSEFKEQKQFSVPKSIKAKAKTILKRPKVKKIKGQKDIRSALSSKSNLITYTEDFNKVCLQSGVDVDAEQLQIAIALSKSIESSCDNVNNNFKSFETQNSKDTVQKIRKTLQEYGFKVPEIKINTSKRRKQKESYKLLITSDSERQQIITDKYSQVLFELPNKVNFLHDENLNKNTSVGVYFKATSIPYDLIKDNNIYYITDLIEKSANTIGSLLKDWSKIPGRPASPTHKTVNMNFSVIDCSQDEVDIILSGSLKCVQNIMKTKSPNKIVNLTDTNIDEPNNMHDSEFKSNVDRKDKLASNVIDVESICDSKAQFFTQTCRSASPDLFDDEESTIIDTKVDIHSSESVKGNTVLMDLTDCCSVASQKYNKNVSRQSGTRSQGSQSNVTRRKSNDMMEITDCVATSSQSLHEYIQNQDHLSVDFGNYKDVNCGYQDKQDIISNTKQCAENIIGDVRKISKIELSPSPNFSLDPCVPNTSCCNIRENNTVVEINDEHHFDIDLTQSSSTSDELPFVYLSGANNKSLDDAIILDENVYVKDCSTVHELIQSSYKKKCKQKATCPAKKDINFEEFICQHLDHSSRENINEMDDFNQKNKQINENEIDLTQSSHSNEQVQTVLQMNETPKSSYDSNNLGKESNVSIDYDELLDKETVNTSMSCSADQLQEDKATNSSQRSAEFEISDNEFNYSIQQSMHMDNFNLGGISVIDNLPNVNSIRKSSSNFSSENNMTNSILSEVEIMENRCHEVNNSKTPFKIPNISVETPTNSAYIVKTNEVTPMLDYASMTTPERNRELNKYGLKPFKRKRAIQLLTHLYNQTHPIIESCEDPVSKKMKKNLQSTSPIHSNYSPKKQDICENRGKISQIVEIEVHNENQEVFDDKVNIYKVTNELPVLKECHCDPDDWVFQKREKSKVHSCRVPLHIAFHNYVSCRRLLKEAILQYEPINIDVIHKDLVVSGHRYDPKDLLKFMDKKCITVKTAENIRNKR